MVPNLRIFLSLEYKDWEFLGRLSKQKKIVHCLREQHVNKSIYFPVEMLKIFWGYRFFNCFFNFSWDYWFLIFLNNNLIDWCRCWCWWSPHSIELPITLMSQKLELMEMSSRSLHLHLKHFTLMLSSTFIFFLHVSNQLFRTSGAIIFILLTVTEVVVISFLRQWCRTFNALCRLTLF